MLTAVNDPDLLHEKSRAYTEFNAGGSEDRDRWHFYLRLGRNAPIPFRAIRNVWYWLDLRAVDDRNPETDPEITRVRKATGLGIPEEHVGVVLYK